MTTAGPSELADAVARQRIAYNLDATLIVEAAAGTGKTSVLVDRIVAILSAGHRGATLRSLVAVTFNEKAAGEMRLRLRQALEDALHAAQSDTPQQLRLQQALAELEVARIGTIHALCADLLREHPVAAEVDPLFEVAIESEAHALLDSTFDAWFAQTLRSPPEGIRRLLRRRARRGQSPPRELLRSAAWQLIEHRDFDTLWRRDSFDREAEIDRLVPALASVGALGALGRLDDQYLRKNLDEIQRFVQDLEHREAEAARDYDGVEAALSELSSLHSWTYKGGGKLYGKNLSRAEVLAKRDAVQEQLELFLSHSDADIAALLRVELLPVTSMYEAMKTRVGKLDFFDLLLRVRTLLETNRGVRNELQERFTHLFIDEFQDTDPMQADILRLLAASDPRAAQPEGTPLVPGKLFIVGDPKQSIYRFRRADVALYERVKKALLDHGATLVDLTTSFRSVPGLQQAVNAAFAREMAETSHSQARYVPLTQFRQPISGQPSLVALPVPRPYAPYGKVTNQAIDESYPDAVGAFIDFLVQRSGWRVNEPGRAELAPILPRHICILFRRFRGWGGDVTQRYVRALEARQIPHVLVGGYSFHAREEVLTLRNALTAIEWPSDELAVYATLHGSLFAFSDDALLSFRSAAGKLHPLKAHSSEMLPSAAKGVAEGLALLGALHIGRNRRPIADIIAELLEATRAHGGFAFWRAGEQALANIAQLTDLARRFEASGGRSFRGFVEKLHQDAERSEAPEAPVVEEGTEGVRMMTVHSSKGLEFPVVILADPTCPHTHKDPSHWVDADARLWVERLASCTPVELLDHRTEVLRREHEESVRLTYVAATRARDLLVVPVVGDSRRSGWVDVLHSAVYPKGEDAGSTRPAPGCPPFSIDSVMDRPSGAQVNVTIAPGLHHPEVGVHEVVWWDPTSLDLDRGHTGGLHQEEVLSKDQDCAANAKAGKAGKEAFETWAKRRSQLLERGSTPSFRPLAAREVRGERLDTVAHELTEMLRTGRPRGRRFGALVHAALAEVALSAGPAEIAQVVTIQTRVLGADDFERRAAIEAVSAALQHPVMLRAAASAAVQRESPISIRLDDGSLAEGVVDLAFLEGDKWTVVDFKTSDQIEKYRPAYEAQLSVYVRAIARATGLPTRGTLLGV